VLVLGAVVRLLQRLMASVISSASIGFPMLGFRRMPHTSHVMAKMLWSKRLHSWHIQPEHRTAMREPDTTTAN